MESKPLPEETYAASETVNVCVTCSNEFVGKFCNRCGEKLISQHERSVLHFLEGAFHVVTHVDGKIFKNLKLLITSPGTISKNYAIGRRQPFMKPIPMFFVANLIYFLLPLFQTFNTTLYSQRYSHEYGDFIAGRIERKMEERKMTFDELAKVYNTKTAGYSKLLLIVMVPMFGLAFAALHFYKKKMLADHLLIALEFMCYILFYCTIFFSFLVVAIVSLLQVMGVNGNSFFNNEMYSIVPLIVFAILYFIYRAERTFYEEKIWVAAIKSIIFIFCTIAVVYAYRFVLFHVTMSFI
jgi:hypothetical protein